MEIRELTEDDVETYWAIRLRALREEPESFGSSYADASARPLADIAGQLRSMRERGDFTLAAVEDGALVGLIAFVRAPGAKNQHNADIYSMYVAPEARSKGYGRALIEETLRRARALGGIEKVALAVVSTNTAARALYQSLGFTTYGLRPQALKLPDGRYLDEDYMILSL